MKVTRWNAILRDPSTKAGVLAGAIFAAVVVPPIVLAADTTSVTERCGASDRNVPTEVVALTKARNVWVEFPAMMRSPMLESDQSATLVIYRDGIDEAGIVLGQPDRTPPPREALGTVVCVVVEGQRPMLHTNVDVTGSRLAP